MVGRLDISYADALVQFPEVVANIIVRINMGKSKARHEPLEAFEWTLHYAENCVYLEARHGRNSWTSSNLGNVVTDDLCLQ